MTLVEIDAEIRRLQAERDLMREAIWARQQQEFERERQERMQLRIAAETGGRNEPEPEGLRV
jgi:hypothetical protein